MQAAAIFMSGLWAAALLLLPGQCIWDHCTAEKHVAFQMVVNGGLKFNGIFLCS